MKNLAFIQEKFVTSLFFALAMVEHLKTRVATLPDLIKLRVNNNVNSLTWNRWITPLTTIYFGKHQGKRIIVVAHHLGPLTTKERILEWAESGTKDKQGGREKYGQEGLPKITQQEFADLVSGKYGEVSIIDFNEYYDGFLSHLEGRHIIDSDALIDPVLKALFGSEIEKFVEKHLQISTDRAMAEMKDLHAEEKILKLEIKDRYGWNFLSQYSDEKEDVFPDEQPVALFLTLGRPDYWGNRDLSVSTSISTHEDLGYGRFTVMNDENDDILDVEFKPHVHWSKCLVDSDELVPDFLVLEEFGGEYFSQYPKEGNRMDTGEIMFRVETIEAIGEPTFFETTDCLFFSQISY